MSKAPKHNTYTFWSLPPAAIVVFLAAPWRALLAVLFVTLLSSCSFQCVCSPVCCAVSCAQSSHVFLCCCALPFHRVFPGRCSLRCYALAQPRISFENRQISLRQILNQTGKFLGNFSPLTPITRSDSVVTPHPPAPPCAPVAPPPHPLHAPASKFNGVSAAVARGEVGRT